MISSLRILAMSLLVGGAALAQPASPDLFSRLTEAERALLLATAGVGSPEAFRPGQLPPALPFRLPNLPGQTLIGSVVQPWSTLVVVHTTVAPEAARVTARKVLALEGWRDQYESATTEGVFQSSFGNGTVVQAFSGQCRPGVPGSLVVQAIPAAGGTRVTYRYSSFEGASSTCPANLEWTDPAQQNFYSPGRNQSVRDPLAELRASGLVLPSLPAPAGTRISPSGSSYGLEGPNGPFYTTYVIVRSAQAPDAVLTHYLTALRTRGWTPGVPRRSKEGEWTVTLTAQQGGKERRATFSLMPRPELGTTEGVTRLNRVDVRFALGQGPGY
ncbi:hypothetical protein [Deinococcus peraridilitoris]|uniref:Uncharacterized protein n=1 Tax=Deinococcus peraridilitoris (strain DSM 19664 / LMG 22246 / CIP 109416 / KR-200) TaxID=937777 RepID=L0A4N9_DEIPD|nr:hypothetical protein [Deinococcus peraridilitoris]AFZ67990.1 hypothetical protein Deipe_2525 [Deinococcus peraridilitoris DSM 19664]